MKLEPIPVQANLMNDIPTDSFSPSMRVNCATLARLFNVSKTSIKRYVDKGQIQLDANGLACPKHAAQSVLESATSNRVKAKFFKTEINTRSAIEAENDALKIKLDGMKTKLIEAQTALTETTESLNEWQADYIQLESTVETFLEQMTTDELLRNAVNECNRDKLQTAFDFLLELEND